MKKRIALAVLSLTVCVALACGAVYAWYAYSEEFINFEFTAGKVDLTVDFYEGVDFDRDGILDPIEQQYVNLGRDLEELIVSGVYPSRVYTYKLKLINMSDVESVISVLWNFGETDGAREILSVQTTVTDNAAGTSSENAKVYLAGLDRAVAAGEFAVAVGGEYDVVFRITCETRESLLSAASDAAYASQQVALTAAAENFNAYSGKNFTLSDITVRIQTQE